MAELQKTDPKAHAWLKDRLWAEKRFRDTVPGGLAEVQKMQSAIAELGQGPIEQVIASVKEELSEGRALDELFANGDLQSLERMIEFAPEGFKKLLPAAIAKYPQLDPEGYQRYGAGLIDRSLAESGITPSLKFMARLIEKGDVEGAKAELAAVLETMKGFGELARSQPKKVEANPEADQRAKNIEDREWKLWLNETAGPINAAKTQAIKAELKQYTKDQQIDEETYEALEAQCLRYVDALLKSDPNFGPTFSSYIENRDREGLTKFMQSKLKEILPSKSGKMGPVEKAYKLFFRGAPKAQPKVGQKPGQQVQKPVPKGWEKVAKAPEPAEIDMNQSPFEMRFGKAAVLKNGKKVFWGDQAPASA